MSGTGTRAAGTTHHNDGVTRRGWVLFLSLSLIWGLPYLLIRVCVESMSPTFVVWGRVLLAALVLLPVAAVRGELPALRGHYKAVLLFAVVEITVTWPALTYAETRLTSSFAALVIAAVPLVGALIAWRLGMDRLTGPRLVGLFVGVAGVAALVGLDFGQIHVPSVALLVITVLGYAFGPVVVTRYLSGIPSTAVIAATMLINVVVFAPFALATRPVDPVPAKAWWSLVALGLLCTAFAFIVFFALVAEVGPARTTVITYLNPMVALVLGVLVLSEPITPGMIVGFPLVLLGSWLATRKAAPQESEPVPA